jgi:transposase
MKAQKSKHLKKAFMWYKVRELREKGLNKTQISLEVGIHRKTVRKYLCMSEEEFYKWLEHPKKLPRKLNDYYEFVCELLETHPYLSAAQVEDRLKEQYPQLPMVHSKTVYNFVQSIRNDHGIKKQGTGDPRQYQKIPESEYGKQAQADIGEYNMLTNGSGRKKVYFFIIVLCRSRHKFVYFKNSSFTSNEAITAHEKAFEYFGGQPKEIIYDQDRVLVIDENLGDVLLTREFSSYCGQMDFKPIFCRKSDPESKGKVENAVGYVKKNFLRGRIYEGEDKLNQSALAWLSRTANAKEHSGTRKVPAHEWETERKYLLPLKSHPFIIPPVPLPTYKVRKDNTISFRSNFYTLPVGTYKGPETVVLVKEINEELWLYNPCEDLLAVHQLCLGRGMTIRNRDHLRDKSQGTLKLKEEILSLMPDKEKGELYIEMIFRNKPRYFRDNLLLMKKHLPVVEKDFLVQSLDFCMENNLYNANTFIEVARHYQAESQVPNAIMIIPEITIKNGVDALDIIPETSDISIYENIL